MAEKKQEYTQRRAQQIKIWQQIKYLPMKLIVRISCSSVKRLLRAAVSSI